MNETFSIKQKKQEKYEKIIDDRFKYKTIQVKDNMWSYNDQINLINEIKTKSVNNNDLYSISFDENDLNLLNKEEKKKVDNNKNKNKKENFRDIELEVNNIRDVVKCRFENKRNLFQLFKQFDRNNDGYVFFNFNIYRWIVLIFKIFLV